MACEGLGGRRDALRILSWALECTNLAGDPGQGTAHKQPLVSLELFMRLPGWLCPLRNIRTP